MSPKVFPRSSHEGPEPCWKPHTEPRKAFKTREAEPKSGEALGKRHPKRPPSETQRRHTAPGLQTRRSQPMRGTDAECILNSPSNSATQDDDSGGGTIQMISSAPCAGTEPSNSPRYARSFNSAGLGGGKRSRPLEAAATKARSVIWLRRYRGKAPDCRTPTWYGKVPGRLVFRGRPLPSVDACCRPFFSFPSGNGPYLSPMNYVQPQEKRP